MRDVQPEKVAKITIRVEWENGQSVNLEAPEPTGVTYAAEWPPPEYDLSGRGTPDSPLISMQPPPTITFRFTASKNHGYTEKLNAPVRGG